MATQKNTGSGIDQPNKENLTSRIIEKITRSGERPVEQDAEDAEKARRIEQERAAYDLDHKPTERDVQIDGSGARFRSDA